MAADIQIAIGLDLSEAVRGRDQLLAINNSISASLDGLVTKTRTVSEERKKAIDPLDIERKKLDGLDRATTALMVAEQKRIADSVSASDRAMASVMTGIAKRQQAEQKADQDRMAAEQKRVSANQKIEQDAARDALNRIALTEKAEETYAANRMRDMQRIRDAQTAQNAKQMSPELLLGASDSGKSAKASASVFSAAFEEEERAMIARENAANVMMLADQRRAQETVKAATSQENAAKRLLSSYAPLAAESERLARDQETLNNLIAQGGPKVQQYQTALANLQQRQAFVATESDRMAKGAALSANQMRNLSYQINDVVSGLLMGQSPWQIFTQQAGQFVQIAQDANMKMTPLRWGILGIGAAGVATFGAIGLHLYRLSDQLKTLTAQATAFNGSMTGADARGQAFGIAAGSMATRGEMVSAMAELIRYRTLSADVTAQIAKTSASMAQVTGQSPSDVVKQLADAANSGYDGLLKLQNAYGALSAPQMDHIRRLSEQGKQSQAAAIMMEALRVQMDKSAQQLRGPMSDAWIDWSRRAVAGLDDVSEKVKYLFGLMSSPPKNGPTEADKPAIDAFDKFRKERRELGLTSEGEALGYQLKPKGVTTKEQFGPATEYTAIQNAIKADTIAAQDLASSYQKQIAAIRALDASARMALEVKQAAEEKYKNIPNSEAAKAQFIAGEMGRRQAEAAREIAIIQFSVDAAQKQADTLQKLGRVEALKRAAQDQARTESFGRPTDVAARQKQILSGQEAQARGALAGQTIDYGIQVRGLEQITAAQTAGTRAQQEAERQVKVLAATEAYRNSALAAGVPVNDNLIKQYEDISRAELAAKQSSEAWAATMQGSANVAYRVQIQNLKDMEAQMRAFGATEEEIAQLYVDAELRKLEASRDWADGATAALMRYSRDASNYGTLAGRAVTNSMNAMENALMGVMTGTKSVADSFRAMASSIIQEMIRMQIQANITGPLSGMLSKGIGRLFGMGGGGYQSAGNATAIASGDFTSPMSTFSGAFASGTDSAPPGLALVGEHGPELMQMGGGERIYPNDQTRAILSGRAANSNQPSGNRTINMAEGAIVVNAPGATKEDAHAIATQVAAQFAQLTYDKAVTDSVSRSVSAVQSLAGRGGSFAQAVGRR